MVVECYSHAIPLAQHLTRHEGIEDASAGQRQAEVEAKKPPIFHILVELQMEGKEGMKAAASPRELLVVV